MWPPGKLPDATAQWLRHLLCSLLWSASKPTQLLKLYPEWSPILIPCMELNYRLLVTYLRLTCNIRIITIKMMPPPQPPPRRANNALQGLEITMRPGAIIRSGTPTRRRQTPTTRRAEASRSSSPKVQTKTPPGRRNNSSPVQTLPPGTPPGAYKRRPLPSVPGPPRRAGEAGTPDSSPSQSVEPRVVRPTSGYWRMSRELREEWWEIQTSEPRMQGSRPTSFSEHPKSWNPNRLSNGSIISPQPKRTTPTFISLSDLPSPLEVNLVPPTSTCSDDAVSTKMPTLHKSTLKIKQRMGLDLTVNNDDHTVHSTGNSPATSAASAASAPELPASAPPQSQPFTVRPPSRSESSVYSEQDSNPANPLPGLYQRPSGESNRYSFHDEDDYGCSEETSGFEQYFSDMHKDSRPETPLSTKKETVGPLQVQARSQAQDQIQTQAQAQALRSSFYDSSVPSASDSRRVSYQESKRASIQYQQHEYLESSGDVDCVPPLDSDSADVNENRLSTYLLPMTPIEDAFQEPSSNKRASYHTISKFSQYEEYAAEGSRDLYHETAAQIAATTKDYAIPETEEPPIQAITKAPSFLKASKTFLAPKMRLDSFRRMSRFSPKDVAFLPRKLPSFKDRVDGSQTRKDAPPKLSKPFGSGKHPLKTPLPAPNSNKTPSTLSPLSAKFKEFHSDLQNATRTVITKFSPSRKRSASEKSDNLQRSPSSVKSGKSPRSPPDTGDDNMPPSLEVPVVPTNSRKADGPPTPFPLAAPLSLTWRKTGDLLGDGVHAVQDVVEKAKVKTENMRMTERERRMSRITSNIRVIPESAVV